MTRATFNDIMTKPGMVNQKIASGDIKITGNPQKLKDFIGMLDTFNLWFNIVTP